MLMNGWKEVVMMVVVMIVVVLMVVVMVVVVLDGMRGVEDECKKWAKNHARRR